MDALLVRDLPDDAPPQAGAMSDGRLQPAMGPEHLLDLALRHRGAVVRHLQRHAVAVAGQGHMDVATGRAVLRCVVDQLAQQQLQAERVAFDEVVARRARAVRRASAV